MWAFTFVCETLVRSCNLCSARHLFTPTLSESKFLVVLTVKRSHVISFWIVNVIESETGHLQSLHPQRISHKWESARKIRSPHKVVYSFVNSITTSCIYATHVSAFEILKREINCIEHVSFFME